MVTHYDDYDAGPQLPNYMKKQIKPAAQSSPSAAPVRGVRTAASRKAPAATKPVAGARANAVKKANATQKKSASGEAYAAKKTKASGSNHTAKPAKRATTQKTAKAAATAKTARKRKKNGASRTLRVLVGIAGIAVAAVLLTLFLGNQSGETSDLSEFLSSKKTFREGVKIVGVNVSGLTAQEATGLVKNAAEKKLRSAVITVRAGGREITLDATALGMSYSIEQALEDGLAYGHGSGVTEIQGAAAGEFDAAYTWSRTSIELALSNMSEGMFVAAVEPSAQPVVDWESAERFTYVEGTAGQELNVEATADRIEDALRSLDFAATVEGAVNAVLPTKTIEDIKAVTKLIASFSTKFSAARDDEIKQNRKFNIQKASDIINGLIVQPGEEWSFNTVVGPRTFDLGWKGANGISGGKEYTIQAGGGICQVSTTLYNALLCGNLEIVYRQAHTIPSDYAEYGFDATVDTDRIDFIWKNNTQHPVYLFARVIRAEGSSSRHTMNVYLYGEPLPEGVEYRPRSELISTTERTDTIYKNDPSIPTGYQKQTNIRRDAYVAEAYLDKYVDGKLVEPVLLYTDKYGGNPAEIAVGTGPALAPGVLPDPLWDVYGTPPKTPGA